jgi:hypothetical protein
VKKILPLVGTLPFFLTESGAILIRHLQEMGKIRYKPDQPKCFYQLEKEFLVFFGNLLKDSIWLEIVSRQYEMQFWFYQFLWQGLKEVFYPFSYSFKNFLNSCLNVVANWFSSTSSIKFN